jgi:outer membrane protein assembly factor BamE
MSMPPSRSGRKSSFASFGAAALQVLFAACIAGCASKNPLMEEPAPVAARDARQAPAQGAEASPAASKGAAETGASAGVQTIKQRRLFGFLSPYRPDIQQGNFVSEEMVAQLKPGMTPDQVRFIMGTPLLTDIFHSDRWDYVFRLQKGNGEVITSRISLFFKNDRLDHLDGGNLPSEKDYLARLTGRAPLKAAPAAEPAPSVPPAQPAPGTARDPSNR